MANKDFKVKNGLDIQTPLPVSMGGTGQTSIENTLNSLLPVQSSNSGKYLTTNGTNASWASVDLSAIQTQIDSKANLTKTVFTQITDYTLTLSDRGKIIEFNSSSDLDLTLPTYSSVPLSSGDNFSIVNRGTGKVNILTQSGTTGLTSYSTTGLNSTTYGGIYANDQYIINSGVSFLRSSDALSWTSVGVTTVGIGVPINQRVAYGNGVWVLASTQGIYSSSSGTSFTLRQANSVQAIKYANNKFIAGGSNGTMYASVDGITWTSLGSVAGITSQSFYNIEYLSGINTWFATVTGSPYLIKSTDNGNTWTSVSGANSNMKGLAADNSILVLVGGNSALSVFYTTTDGINFTTKNYGASVYAGDIIYGNGIFAHTYNIGSTTLYLSTSSDGINWTTQSSIAVASSGAGYTLMLNPSSGYSVLGSITSAVFKAGTATTSYISKNGATSIPSYGRAEIYNYNQNQFVVAGDLGNPVATNKGDTASRPSSPTLGDLYYNTDYNYFESYTANGWFPIAAAPLAPTGVTATDQGTGRAYNNGQASVAFTPNSSGGAPSSFIVTPSPTTYPSTFTTSTSPATVSGLASSTQYTYTVQATSPYGTSSASSASSGVTATTVPQAPSVSATAGNAQATILITPGATGGSSITQYSITSNPATTTQTTSNTTYTFTGLTNGTAYTFTVTATNSNGTSTPSAVSNSVTPTASIVLDALVIGGGGGAYSDLGGGGGAGGVVYATSFTASPGVQYNVTIGGGGTSGGSPTDGGNSTFSSFTANGGSASSTYGATARSGGSGGGGSHRYAFGGISNQGSGSGYTGFGTSGGNSSQDGGNGSGGGGGASQAGQNAQKVAEHWAGGKGGDGKDTWSDWGLATSSGQNISGTYWFAGGGGGGSQYYSQGAGGKGGGGRGGTHGWSVGGQVNPLSGEANTGGGAGGWDGSAAGGSGIVIIRTASGVNATTSASSYTSGAYKYFKFTSNGSITF